MNRAAVLVIAALSVAPAIRVAAAPAAAATSSEAPPSAPAPDEIADVESREANLESAAPRVGLVFAVAAGFGVLIGGDIGVGRGGALSLRVGHVATRRTVITFEITATGALHKPATAEDPVTDTNAGLFAGAQTYPSSSTWVRIAGGPTVFTANIGGDQRTAGGIGGIVGGGFDLARWGYAVLGLETFAMTSLTRDEGFKLQLGFALGLAHY